MKPPKFAFKSAAARMFKGARPKLGIGIVIGALLVIGTQMSGSDSAFAMVLGGGVGIAVGLTRRSGPDKLTGDTTGEEEPEEGR